MCTPALRNWNQDTELYKKKSLAVLITCLPRKATPHLWKKNSFEIASHLTQDIFTIARKLQNFIKS